jgi:integrase
MTVRKRRGSWFCDITIDGKRVQRVIKGAGNKAQALKAEAVIRTQLFEKKYGLVEKPECRFDKFVKETFLPYSRHNNKSYERAKGIALNLCEYFGPTPLQEITSSMVEKFKQERAEHYTRPEKKINKATVNRELAVLSKIFSLAVDAEQITTNPCSRVRHFQASNGRIRYLTPDEENRLLAALESHKWVRDVVVMALQTGMRQGEIFNLQWFDVDFERGWLHVRNTKSGKDRSVPMNSKVRQLLESLTKSSGYVFPSIKTGGRMVDVKSRFAPACKEAGLTNFRFHDLRHCAATKMIERGIDIVTVKEVLGHSDIRMTARYAHATNDAKRRAVEKLAETGTSRDSKVTKEKGRRAGLPKS